MKSLKDQFQFMVFQGSQYSNSKKIYLFYKLICLNVFSCPKQGIATVSLPHSMQDGAMSHKCKGRKEGNVLFNDALNTFYLCIWCWAYGKGPLR